MFDCILVWMFVRTIVYLANGGYKVNSACITMDALWWIWNKKKSTYNRIFYYPHLPSRLLQCWMLLLLCQKFGHGIHIIETGQTDEWTGGRTDEQTTDHINWKCLHLFCIAFISLVVLPVPLDTHLLVSLLDLLRLWMVVNHTTRSGGSSSSIACCILSSAIQIRRTLCL